MPANPRVRTNNVQGTITDNPLLIGATTINSAGLANLAAVATQHAVIILDPLRSAGAPEIVVVTAHTGAATSATVSRGAYGTSARQHALGTLWVHAALTEDFIAIVTSGTRPSDPYRGQLIFETDTDSLVARSVADAWQTVVDLGGWEAYSPTWTQGATVTKTDTYAKYQRVGRIIKGNVKLTATGAGTAANAVTVTAPVTAAASGNLVVGSGNLVDISANANYTFVVVLSGTGTFSFIPCSADQSSFLGVGVFTAALANTDTISFCFEYEAAA